MNIKLERPMSSSGLRCVDDDDMDFGINSFFFLNALALLSKA